MLVRLGQNLSQWVNDERVSILHTISRAPVIGEEVLTA
jgi:hypothetical protein